jgi:hypothetical protein
MENFRVVTLVTIPFLYWIVTMFDVSTLILACIYWLLIALVINENNIICTEGSYKAYIVKALYYE